MARSYRAQATQKVADERREFVDKFYSIEQQLEEAEEMNKVYIITQEYKPGDSEYELLEGTGFFYETRQGARDALKHIAAQHDVELDSEDDLFGVPTPVRGLDYDIYYIEELSRG